MDCEIHGPDCLTVQGMREGAPVGYGATERCGNNDCTPDYHVCVDPSDGRKDDSSKLRYDLIPPYALEALAHVYTLGADKYGEDNYMKGLNWRRVGGALMRHWEAWRKGERLDRKDGQLHLASVAWCAFTLMVFEDQCIGVDDRGSSITVEEDDWPNDRG